MSCFCWRCELAYAIPYDPDPLNLLPVNALHLMHVNLLDKLSDDLSTQFFHICVLAHNGKEVIYVDGAFFLVSHELFQFNYSGFEFMLFILVTCCHLSKTLIGNLSFDVVFIKPLNNLVQLSDASL